MQLSQIIEMISAAKLLQLVNDGEIDDIRYLIEQGVDINTQGKNGETMLMRAIKTHQFEIAKYLIEKGANIALDVIEPHYLHTCICNRKTLLSEIVYHDTNCEILVEVLKQDINVELEDGKGCTAFYYAQRCNNTKAVTMLEEYKQRKLNKSE